jgi:hypothetical protein
MENYRFLRPYREWVHEKYKNFNSHKKRESREAMKLLNRAMFPFPITADKHRMQLATKYLNRRMSIHMLRQQINQMGRLHRISPPVSPIKKNKKLGRSSPIPIKTKTRK